MSTVVVRPGTQFEAITWGPNGQIYTLDFATGEVFTLDLLAGSVQVIGQFNGALGGALDLEGNFYFSEFNTGRIIKIDSTNQSSVYTEGLVGPAGILIDEDAQVMYVSNYFGNSISKINMTDAVPTPEVLASGGLIDGPDGLVFSPEGDIISANFNNNRVQRITKEGEVSAFSQITSSINTGYLINLKDRYIITGANGNDIYSMTFEGDFEKISGSGTAGYEDGTLDIAVFNFPNGISSSPTGDSLLITESGQEGRIRLVTGLNVLTATESEFLIPTVTVSPNPTNNNITVEFNLRDPDTISMQLLDIHGKLMKTLAPPQVVSGLFRQDFKLDEGLSNGIYLIQIQCGPKTIQHKIVKR